MKAVIVECSNGAAVALCDDGTFRKLKNKGYFIGQELLIKHKPSANRMVQKLSICASLALVLLSFAGIGSHSLAEPYSYVSLDINPSIEYALNRYDKVISVSGINNEGQQVVSSIESDIKNQNITTALGVTIGQLEKEHYIIQEAYNHVIVSVYSANNTKAQSIASRVNTFSAEKSGICSIDTIPVSKEVKDDADSLGITPGKLALIHAVAETTSDSNFNVSEWTNKTVSELETTIQQASSQIPDSTGTQPVNVVNSEYLSSVLDDNTANKDHASAPATGADKEAGSASTDTQTNTDDTTAGSDTDGTASDSKPDQSGSTVPPADGSTASTDKPGSSNASSTNSSSTAAGNNNSSTADQNTTADTTDQNTSPDKNNSGTSPSKNPESQNSGSSPSKGDTSSDSVSRPDSGDTLTEDNAIKKDPYPPANTVTDTPQNVPNSSPSGDSSSNQGSSFGSDTSASGDSVADESSAENIPAAGSAEKEPLPGSDFAEN